MSFLVKGTVATSFHAYGAGHPVWNALDHLCAIILEQYRGTLIAGTLGQTHLLGTELSSVLKSF